MTTASQAKSGAASAGPAAASSRAFQVFLFGSIFSALVGVALAAAVILGLDQALLLLSTLAFLPGPASATLSQEAALNAAIAGGVLAGWGMTLYSLAKHLGESGLKRLSGPLLTAVIVWFVLDGAGSWAAGAPANIVLNLPYLLLLGGPLLALRGSESS